MIAELEAERQRLDEAIIVLERLSATKRGRRAREPKPVTDISETAVSDGSRSGKIGNPQ